MNVKNKISEKRKEIKHKNKRLEDIVKNLKILGVAILGIAIGISYTISYTTYQDISEPTVMIIEREQSSGDEPSNAHHEAPGADGTSVSAGVLEEEAEQSASLSIEDAIRNEFGETMLAVLKHESRLDPTRTSTTDYTADGHPFSVGLGQINLTVHPIGDYNCPDAFSGKNYDAVVVDQELYEACVKTAKDPEENIKKIREIYATQGIYAWGSYLNGAYQQYL